MSIKKVSPKVNKIQSRFVEVLIEKPNSCTRNFKVVESKRKFTTNTSRRTPYTLNIKVESKINGIVGLKILTKVSFSDRDDQNVVVAKRTFKNRKHIGRRRSLKSTFTSRYFRLFK